MHLLNLLAAALYADVDQFTARYKLIVIPFLCPLAIRSGHCSQTESPFSARKLRRVTVRAHLDELSYEIDAWEPLSRSTDFGSDLSQGRVP